MLPSPAFERDPTVDYRVHKAALYTMATCHSLRLVDGKPVGDPLDIKMFEYTGWSIEESGRKASTADSNALDEVPTSIVRPLNGLAYNIDDQTSIKHVSTTFARRSVKY